MVVSTAQAGGQHESGDGMFVEFEDVLTWSVGIVCGELAHE